MGNSEPTPILNAFLAQTFITAPYSIYDYADSFRLNRFSVYIDYSAFVFADKPEATLPFLSLLIFAFP